MSSRANVKRGQRTESNRVINKCKGDDQWVENGEAEENEEDDEMIGEPV